MPSNQVDTLVLSYYHPWIWGECDRFLQLTREELRLGRRQAFVYITEAGDQEIIARNIELPEYAALALYRLVSPTAAEPVSPFAKRLTGDARVELSVLASELGIRYVRSHHPAEGFERALKDPAFLDIPFIYDVIDLWDEFVATPWGTSATEAFYASRADAIAVVSTFLRDRFQGSAPVHVVPNAIDRTFLRRIAPAGTPPKPEGSRKQVLYMGCMSGTWFDWELTRRLAHELPDHDFTLLGPVDPPPEELNGRHQRQIVFAKECLADLARLPHVRVVPMVPHDELVPWLRSADVGLIPFIASDLVAAVSPLKIYEYLGAGAEVVQIGMPDIETYPGVRTARGHDDFVELVRTSDGRRLGAPEAAEIAAFIGRNTWLQRLEQLDAIVDDLASGGWGEPGVGG